MPVFRDVGTFALGDLRGNIAIYPISGQKGDVALRLDLEQRIPRRAHPMDDQVVEFVAKIAALEPHLGDPSSGQTMRRNVGQHR